VQIENFKVMLRELCQGISYVSVESSFNVIKMPEFERFNTVMAVRLRDGA